MTAAGPPPGSGATPPAEPLRVVRVLPDVPAIAKAFDYAVPDALGPEVRVGSEVRVVLGGRRVGGWVVADGVEPAPGVALRPLAAVRGWGPPPAVLDLVAGAAWRWAGRTAALARTASAPRVVRQLPSWRRPGPDGPPASMPVAPGGADEAVTTVVRVGPAADLWPWCGQAAALLQPGASDGAGVLVLAPGHQAAVALARRLRQQGAPVALRPDEWARARAGGCVAVGTRAAAFAPLPRLAAAVVLDAHDEAYHEERAPTWAAWAVVAERARRDGAPCWLVSPCPTLELLAAGPLVAGSRADERAAWPVVEVVDRRHDDPRTGLFSERLVRMLRDVAAVPGRRVVCVVNRTGRVRLLSCASCGELARCDTCGAALELLAPADATPVLHCRRCGSERPVVCAHCGATRTRALRVGVSRIREELEALVGVPVGEVWGPAPRPSAGTGHDDATRPEAQDAAVVVGTEAALHRVGAAHAVAFLEFDSELAAPRFRAGEQALALLARAARLVGAPPGDRRRARAQGLVLVQTRQPRHPALVAAVSADPGILDEAETEVRRALGLPPFSALAVVSGAAAGAYGAALRAGARAGVSVVGPVDGSWTVRAPDHGTLSDLLASVPRPAGRLRVEVDPVRA